MKEFCRKGHMTRGGKRWLAILMSVCLIGTMIPISARAVSGNYYEESFSLVVGKWEYNNNRYLCLPDTKGKKDVDIHSNWSNSNPEIVEIGSQKYFEELGFCVLATAKSVGETTVTCTYKLDDVDYTLCFQYYGCIPGY